MLENMEMALREFAEKIEEITAPINECIEENLSSGGYDALLDLINSLPDDIQKTEVFSHIENLKKAEISYDEIEWIQNIIGYMTYDESVQVLHDKKKKSQLDQYVLSIIESKTVSRREKIIVLLAHFEMLVYQTKPYERKAWDSLKNKVTDEVKIAHDMILDNYSKLLVAGIVFIVYSNTDNYKNDIDKRIPFRNNILHRGVIDYSDEEISEAYEILVYFISELTLMEKRTAKSTVL